MIRCLAIILTLITLSLADCNSYNLLGLKEKSFVNVLNTEDTIIWNHSKDGWVASEPIDIDNLSSLKCEESGYFLVNSDRKIKKVSSYIKENYDVHKGWNYLHSHKNGIDIKGTF